MRELKYRKAPITLAVSVAILLSTAVMPAFSADQTLTVYSFKGTPGQEADMPAINALFEAEYPDIKLNYVAMPAGTAYESKIQVELLAGKSGDVIMAQGTQLTQLSKNGYFVDLSNEPWAANVLEQVKPFFSYDNQLYAMPLLGSGIGMFSNMDVLAAAGITSVPTDWPSFLDALAKVKAAGYTPIAIPDKLGWGGAMTFLNMGSTLVPSTWADDYWNGKGDFSTWLPVLRQIMELEQKGLIDWKEQLGVDEFSQGLANFKQGKTAFWVQGMWNISDLQTNGINFQFTAVPAGPAGSSPKVFLYAGAGWTISATSPNIDAARKYVAFQARPDISLKYLTADGGLSMFKDAPSPEFKGVETFNQSYAAGDFSYMATSTWFGDGVQEALGSKLQAMLLGQITPEETAKALDSIGLRKQ